MRKNAIIKGIFVFLFITFLALLSSALCEAQQKKDKTSASQKPVKLPRMIPFSVHGHVTKDGKGVPGVKVSLIAIRRVSSLLQRRLLAPVSSTDKNGRYSFVVHQKNEGKKYRLVPRHPAFAPGQHFYPRQKEFTLTKSMRVNFTFTPPKFTVQGTSKTTTGRKLYRTEMRLHQVLGPHQYKYIGTKQGSICTFKLDYDVHGKKFRLQPRHLQVGVFGVYFTPKEEIFTLTSDKEIPFTYTGPLPDLMVAGVKRPTSYIIITIKNIGKLGAGKCNLFLGYNTYNSATGANPYTIVERIVPALAAGASTELQFFKPVPSGQRITVRLIRVDYGNKVVESDESNNKWGN